MVQVFQELTESEDGYMLHEIEANSFLPYLINKMGDPKVGATRTKIVKDQ